MPAHVSAEYQREYKRRKLAAAGTKPCECGCGTEIPAIKWNGGPRRYAPGHVPREQLSEWGRNGNPRRDWRCADCGEPCSAGATRCLSCSRAKQRRQPRYCEACGAELTGTQRRACSTACAGRLRRGERRVPDAEAAKATLCRRAREHLADRCACCGATERLEAHHRDGDRANSDAANIETLCKSCHLAHHR